LVKITIGSFIKTQKSGVSIVVRLDTVLGLGRRESGGGPPHSKTLARVSEGSEWREAFWSAADLCRFRHERLAHLRYKVSQEH
jgi:hypothetical protein